MSGKVEVGWRMGKSIRNIIPMIQAVLKTFANLENNLPDHHRRN